MPELAEVETPKTAGFVDRGYNNAKRKQRMEEEAKEIERLEAQARGETPVDAEEEVEEATQEAEANTEVKEETLSAEEKSFKKRYGDLRRHMQQKEKEWDEKLENLQKASTKAGIIPPKSDEDIEEWAKEYPDVAGIVKTIAAKKHRRCLKRQTLALNNLTKLKQKLIELRQVV